MRNIITIFIFTISCASFGQVKKSVNADSVFSSIIGNPNTKLDRKTYTKRVVKEFYELQQNQNKWTAFKEYYGNGKIKEKGVFLNGDSFGIWLTYNKKGKVISKIDYSTSRKIIGNELGFEENFELCKSNADRIIKTHFGLDNKIKLNASRSYWYSENSSGTWFEKRIEKPTEFLLRYSYQATETNTFGIIELHFDSDLNLITKKSKGLPTKKPYQFKISYDEAMKIAKSNNYGLINHQNAFKGSEYLELYFDSNDDSYKWIISNIPKTNWKAIENTNSGTITGIGKTLYIDSSTGLTKETDFGGIINVN